MQTTVGPLPPEVYWRRRFLAVALIVVALVTLRACAGGDSSRAGRSASPSTSSPADGSSSHPYAPRMTSPSPSVSPSPAASPSAAATPSGSPRPAAIGPCPDGSLELTVTTDARTYRVGAKPKLTMTLRNAGAVACRRDLGSAAREVIITSGMAHTWSSADCQRPGVSDVALLAAGSTQRYSLAWPGHRSPIGCAGPAPVATAGTYRVQARLGTLRSSHAVFQLR